MILEATTAFFSVLETIYASTFDEASDRDVVVLSLMVWGWYCIGCDDIVYAACARLRDGGTSAVVVSFLFAAEWSVMNCGVLPCSGLVVLRDGVCEH